MRKKIGMALAVFSLLVLANCATITRGTDDVLEIKTNPQGADVQTSNGFSCDGTPCSIEIPRKSTFVAEITKTGCEPAKVNVTNETSDGGTAALFGNIIFGGIIGLVVDLSTGAAKDLTPNPIDRKLNC